MPNPPTSANLAPRRAHPTEEKANLTAAPPPQRVALFATCIIDQIYPQVGVSVVRTLRRHGVSVAFPPGQTCCGQPLYNAGYTTQARQLAIRVLNAFADPDANGDSASNGNSDDANDVPIIVPSGSCGAMLRVFYLDLFADDPDLLPQAQSLAARVSEFTEFLAQIVAPDGIADSAAIADVDSNTDPDSISNSDSAAIANVDAATVANAVADTVADADVNVDADGDSDSNTDSDSDHAPPDHLTTTTVAYHPSCHLLRELGVQDAPRQLLAAIPGLALTELPNAEQCCGFGGAFAVKYPHISAQMLADKLDAITASGADTVTACDLGCLMHIEGGISRRQLPIRARHIAQLLDDPTI